MDAIASSNESGKTGASFGDGTFAFAGSEPFYPRHAAEITSHPGLYPCHIGDEVSSCSARLN